MRSYTCKTCGAELILNDDNNFTNCLYCGNSIAITNEELKDLNIKKIIPFSIDKEEAIQTYEKIIRKKIVEAKKVYVPVRYCNFDFDYLLYYEYRVESEDSNGHTTVSYYDAETLIDGNVKDEIVFGDSKVNYVNLPFEIRSHERLEYDPVLLKDVSIECSNFDKSELIKKGLEQDVRIFGKSKIKRDISEIYSENYFIYGINYEPFTTLIPVYIIKTAQGEIYNYPGTNPAESLQISNSITASRIFSLVLILNFVFSILMISALGASYYMISIVGLIIGIVLLVSSFSKNSKLVKKSYENYDYEKYEYGDHRKNIK